MLSFRSNCSLTSTKELNMPTINGDAYEPIHVIPLDLVGFLGEEGFVILNPFRKVGRNLPSVASWMNCVPFCTRCKIENNQPINFHGTFATLHNINGEWHVRMQVDGRMRPLSPHTFFEIGHQL